MRGRLTILSLSVLLSLGALLFAVPAWAHHSNSAFYVEKIIEVKGVITKWEWVNPHTFIYIMLRRILPACSTPVNDPAVKKAQAPRGTPAPAARPAQR